MKVVILCGGLGTRLREETEFKPKPMVRIGSHPILWHIMKTYSHFGFHDFVLCLGYRGDVIKEYFYHYHILNHNFSMTLGQPGSVTLCDPPPTDDWRITLVDTGEKALKGARIKRVAKYVGDEDFLLTYGDGVANIDMRRLVDFHRRHGKIGTVTGVRPPSLFGELQTHDGKVEIFSEKPQTSGGLINGGFFVFSPLLLEYLSDDDGCDFERGALENLARDGQLMVYDHPGQWACMDTVRDFEHLNMLWASNRAFWKVWS